MTLSTDQLPQAVLALGEDDRVTQANGAARRLFGRQDLEGVDASELLGCPMPRAGGRGRDPARAPGRGRGQITRPDGTPVPVDFSMQATEHDGDDRWILVLLEVEPEHERRLVEDRLRERERQLEEAQRIAGIGSWEVSFRDGSAMWSDGLRRLYGLAEVDMPSTLEGYLELVHPEDRERVRRSVLDAVGALTPMELEHRIVRPDGAIRDIRALGRIDLDESGRPLRMLGTAQDVTVRKRAELELSAAREHSEAIVSAMAEGYLLTVDQRIVAVNDALCAMTGFPRDELIGTTMPHPFWPPELAEAGVALRSRIIAADRAEHGDAPAARDVEIELMRKDGTRFDAELTVSIAHAPDGTAIGYVSTVREVSERKRRDAELERERRDLNAAQAVARIGSWEYGHAGGGAGRWSLQLWRMLGLEPRREAPPYEEFLAMVHRDDRARVSDAMRLALAAKRPWDGEFRMVVADGRELHVAFRHEVSRDANGVVVGAFGTIQDITERAHRDAEQAALRLIAELVAEKGRPEDVFTAVADQVRELFGAHGGMVARFDPAGNRGILVSGCTAEGPVPEGVTFPLDGITASAEVFRTGRPASYSEPLSEMEDGAVRCLHKGGITGGMAAPIYVAGELWGAVAAAFAGRPVPEDAEPRLGRFADLVAMAIANAEAWETLARQASTDPITGLANHRTFYERLRSEVQRARRYHRELSVVLLDLDHFKAVNDAFGHQIGDGVLVEFAQRLSHEAREGELVARIGGEEFAWLMPETAQDGAYQAAERIRRAIEAEPFSEVGRITVSAGVCSSDPTLDGEDLVRYADRALYWAKDGGRNTTFLYTPEAHAVLSREAGLVERLQVMSSVRALARAIDSKDSSTGRHSERVGELAQQLALQLGWTARRAGLLHACGLLHDVGKIGIPDELLLRSEPLTDVEYEKLRRHAELSAQIAAEVLEPEQVRWIRGHHERWDGSGYPDRLAGQAIPDGAQLLALADAWDVMTETRTYKAAKTLEEAVTEVRRESGRQFAPAAVDALIAVLEGAAISA